MAEIMAMRPGKGVYPWLKKYGRHGSVRDEKAVGSR
jgi:hypothetical protein